MSCMNFDVWLQAACISASVIIQREYHTKATNFYETPAVVLTQLKNRAIKNGDGRSIFSFLTW